MALSPRVPDLGALELLLAIGDTASLNAAARRVGISQQAVSSRIAAMEAQSGVRLVTRSSRGSALTPAGILVAQWSARVLAAAAELDAGLASLRTDQQTKLRIAASLTVAEQLLPGWLVSFRLAGPARSGSGLQVTLTAANSDAVLARVGSGEADLGFIESPAAVTGLRTSTVAHDHLVLVCRPDDPLARRRRPLSARGLQSLPLVAREVGSGTRDALAAALRRVLGPEAAPAEPVLILSTTSAVRAAVLAGAGPAVLSELAVAEDLPTGRLVQVPVPEVDLRRRLRAVWAGSAQPPAGAIRDLLGHIGRNRRPDRSGSRR